MHTAAVTKNMIITTTVLLLSALTALSIVALSVDIFASTANNVTSFVYTGSNVR